MSFLFLLLPRVVVKHANALAGQYLINTAPVMAMNLFAHALCCETDCTLKAVAILHHDAYLEGESGSPFFGLHPHQRRGAVLVDKADYSRTNKHALSLQPTATMNLTVSLLLEITGAVNLPKVERFLLQGGRIAGGCIEQVGEIELVPDLAQLTLPNGYWVIERQDLMQVCDNPVDALFAAIGKTTPNQADSPPAQQATTETDQEHSPADGDTPDAPAATSAAKLPDSWLIPTILGYSTLTPFEKRPGTRLAPRGESRHAEWPLHAYCESMIGLVQYLPARQWPNSRPLPFWQQHWLDDFTFVVTQQSNSAQG
ncbi:CRISPR-associated protein Csy2 [Chitinivorax tropicus]|uniref:CRISPR-associated protein Csy2 n=1 Tax=Chitinivorax tropicus TaxID=714531 RepID=A0A840MQK0_9PROT|nr:type I-F CRISPR-associated protein Csy2 [Chitinivorax tropicus]MBB5018453.1 CRISPR-associated protein Csy2 [Chitinivorax tropicus]